MAQLRARDEALGEEWPQTPASVGEHLSIGGSSRGSSGSRRSVKLEILKLQLEAQLRREEREQKAQLRREEREAQLRTEEREAEGQLKRDEREAQLRQEEREAQLRKKEREAQLRKEEREAQLHKEEREAQLHKEGREAQLKREEREAQLRREEREAQLCKEEREAQLRREQRKLEARLKQQEVEANKEVELKRAELGLAPPVLPKQEDRRVTERDLPVFVPNEAEGFFDHFERIATLKKWPRAELVQSRLTGEALEAYNMLDLRECTNYVAVKRAVLHSFKLTLECYRKKFRECTRSPGKSYAETARDMERKFLKWLESKGAKSTEDVKRLKVMEKFMFMLSPEIRVIVKEADIKDLRATADRADMLEEAL
ncbi:trichohyalin-like [Procambarus clarkii]|uniref:trichohyalin-like n=1 Tax=Procambarus clarkii TaxID=6728 RepID=UPI0037426683